MSETIRETPSPGSIATTVHRPDDAKGSGTSVVRLDGVTKRFGDVVAVDNLTLDIARGEFFGDYPVDGPKPKM